MAITKNKDVSSMVEIETVFRARIDYDFDDALFLDNNDTLSRKRRAWEDKYSVSTDNWRAGPCWNAYFIIEGASENNVRKVAEMITRYILNTKGGKIL